MLARDVDQGMQRAEQAKFALTEEEFILGGKRQSLAAAIQFSLPGIPSIYYGDEAGMTGLLDPFNRRAFREEDPAITEQYRTFAGLRRAHPVMSTGNVRFFSTDGSVLGVLRYTTDRRDFFGTEIGSDAVLTVVNPVKDQRRIVIELDEIYGEPYTQYSTAAASLLTGLETPFEKGLIEIDMPPLSADIFGFVK